MRSVETLVGALLVVVGAVLLIWFRDSEFGWFRGQPLGLVLLALGVLDLAGSLRRRE